MPPFSLLHLRLFSGFPDGSDSKESACNAGDPGSIPQSGRSPGEGNGNPLQYSCLENATDRGVWWLQAMGLQRVGHDWATDTFILLFSFFSSADIHNLVQVYPSSLTAHPPPGMSSALLWQLLVSWSAVSCFILYASAELFLLPEIPSLLLLWMAHPHFSFKT